MGNIIDVSEATFETDVIAQSAEIAVIVDFWAPWCGPCKMLSPILEKLASDPDHHFILAKVNVDENPKLSMQYRVQGIPAVKGFLNGEVVSEFTGVIPEPRIREFIANLIPDETDQAILDGKSLLATQHWADAEYIFEELVEQYPNRADINLGLASALIAQGSGCEALHYLKQIRDGREVAQAEKLTPLANFLCRIAEIDDDDDEEYAPLELQYMQAGRLFARGNFEAALDGLIDVLRQDKRYRKGEPKNVVLGIFALLGDHNTLTLQYRNELASVMF